MFSLVDKLVSSLGSTVVGVAVAMIGIQTLPDGNTVFRRNARRGDRIVLYRSDACMDHYTDRDEGIYTDRKTNERDPGGRRSP